MLHFHNSACRPISVQRQEDELLALGSIATLYGRSQHDSARTEWNCWCKAFANTVPDAEASTSISLEMTQFAPFSVFLWGATRMLAMQPVSSPRELPSMHPLELP